jgi:hypothetical protein
MFAYLSCRYFNRYFVGKIYLEMPKFVYTIILISMLFWGYLYYLIDRTLPETLFNIFWMLLILSFALASTLSVPFYHLVKRNHSEMRDQRLLFRKSFKWGFFISFGVVGLLTLSAFDLFNAVNVTLYAIFYLALLYQIRSKR